MRNLTSAHRSLPSTLRRRLWRQRFGLLSLLLISTLLADSFSLLLGPVNGPPAPVARAYAAGAAAPGTPAPTQTASPSPTATRTPIPPPTPAPTLTPIPDIDYVDQGIARERDDLLAQVAALPVLTGTITGTVVSGLTGGRVISPDGRFSLGLRPGLVPTTDTVRIQLSVPTFPPDDPHATRDGQPLAFSYVLTATRGSDGARLEHFNPQAVLVWNIDSAALAQAGVHGFPLHVYTFDEAAEIWQEVLSYWKPETGQLLAATPHFSLYSVGDGFDAVDNYVPTVNGFEVDLQSGAATVQYPFNLPPGPGGFAPKVTLSYNSTQVDRVDRTQQGPSNVGWGWTLSTNYIAATQHHFGTPLRHYDPWTASIVVDGINGDLVKGTDGYWHTATEQYARVLYHPGDGTQSNDWWEAWDKDGTRYVFDQRAYTFDVQNDTSVAYRWMLHTATDVHGNVVNYVYAYEDVHANLSYTPPAFPTPSVAVYPYQITYGGNFTGTVTDKIQVSFDIITRTIGITNDIGTLDRNSPFYQSYRIDKVNVARRQQVTGAFAQLRAYELKQDYSTVLTDTAGDKYPHLTLTDIVPHGNGDGSAILPATHFDYLQSTTPCCPIYPPEDWGHLWYVNNGYGGKIGFYYDAAGGDAPSWSRRVRAKRVKDGFDTLPDDPPHSVAYFYDYRGGAVADQAHSVEPSTTPVHAPGKEFRGYGWVRVQDPMGQMTDHYFSQDDIFKAREWRVQGGKAKDYVDAFDTTPTATPNPNWTVSGPVLRTPDPDNSGNGAWELDQDGVITRTVAVKDGADVSVRLRVDSRSGSSNPQFAGTWKLVAANGDYWGLKFHPVWNGKSYDLLPQAVWSVGGVPGTRDLSSSAPFTPRWLSPLATARWYRVQLHTSPDGRFALELYEDRTDSDAHKAYLQIKSGDRADSSGITPAYIPLFPTGQQWQFAQQVTTADGYAALADDYSELHTVYSQNDSSYADQTHISATSYDGSDWHVGNNNCQNMVIRFLPLTAQSSSLYGTNTQLGQTKRTQQTYTYDDYGNQTELDVYGDVASSGDERSTISAYATLSTTTTYIVDKVAQTSTYQGIGGTTTLMARMQYYYDNQALFGIVKGDLTKREQVGVLGGGVTVDRSATQFVYDAYGNQIQQIDPDNHQPAVTTYDPYYFAFPMQITHPNGRSESMAYDFTVDSLTSQTDMNGTMTHHQPDAFGRPAKTWIDGFGTQTQPNEQYFFQDLNQLALTPPFYISYQQLLTGTLTTWQTRWFDGLGRKIQDVAPRGDGASSIVVDTTYTNTGVLSSTTWPYVAANSQPTATVTPDPGQPKTIHYYDGAGRPSMVVNPDNSTIIYDYSLLQWTASQDESGHIRSQHTDLLGRVDQVQEYGLSGATPVTTGYTYDILDRLQQVTRAQGDPLQTTGTLTYDALGRKSQVQDPDLGTWAYGYDAAGNVLTQTDALGQMLLFSYDDMNRMTAKYYGQAHQQAGTPDVRYYYDNTYLGTADANIAHSWGRLRNVEVMPVQGSKANRHSYLYDARGLPAADAITTTFNTQIYTVTYGYDVGGRLTTLTYPNATGPEQVRVGYNTQGAGLPNLLTSSISGNPAPVSNAAYNARSQLATLVQGDLMAGNLLTTTLTYDDASTRRGWLTRQQVVTSTATLLDLNLGYAANGDVTGMSQLAGGPNSPVFTNTYTYDDLDRLATATSNLYDNETYGFDALGRMASRTIGGISYPYTYGNSAHSDAPTAYHGNSYGYDANGSQTTGTVGGRNETRTFDPEHRVSRIVTTGASSATVDFVYDGNGKRVAQSVTTGSGTTSTLYVGNLYEEELTGGSNPPYIVYYFLGAQAVGLRRANQSSSNGQYRLVSDHLGSTTLLVDTSNPPQVGQRQYYKPYGESAFQHTAQGSLTSHDFTGQRLDSDTGLLYYGARYYDPGLSYFISPDPTVPNSLTSLDLNRYLYTRGNPLRYIDTSGYGPDDQYVFVNGCVGDWNQACSNNNAASWGDYIQLLHQLFDEGKWGEKYAYYYGGELHGTLSWEQWSAAHVHFQAAGWDLKKAASNLNDLLKGMTGNYNIHLIGTSQGAAAILQYFAQSMAGDYTINSRISSFTSVEGNLDAVANVPTGAWLSAHTRIKTASHNPYDQNSYTALTVDSPLDVVNHHALPGIAYEGNPNYGPEAPTTYRGYDDFGNPVDVPNPAGFHIWTGSHMAVETAGFLRRVWY